MFQDKDSHDEHFDCESDVDVVKDSKKGENDSDLDSQIV